MMSVAIFSLLPCEIDFFVEPALGVDLEIRAGKAIDNLPLVEVESFAGSVREHAVLDLFVVPIRVVFDQLIRGIPALIIMEDKPAACLAIGNDDPLLAPVEDLVARLRLVVIGFLDHLGFLFRRAEIDRPGAYSIDDSLHFMTGRKIARPGVTNNQACKGHCEGTAPLALAARPIMPDRRSYVG